MNYGRSIVLICFLFYTEYKAVEVCKSGTAINCTALLETGQIKEIYRTWCNTSNCTCEKTCINLDCQRPTPRINCSDQTDVKDKCTSGNCTIVLECNGMMKIPCKSLVSSTTKTSTRSTSTVITRTSTAVPDQESKNSSTSSSTSTSTDRDLLYKGDKRSIVISVTVPVLVLLVCAIVAAVLLIRRCKKQVQTKVKFHGTAEREPGNLISNTSDGNHDGQITNISENGNVPNGTSNDYAQIVDNVIPDNEQTNEYQTIYDIPHIKPSENASYSHVKSQTATNMDSNYSHFENTKNVKSKTVDYEFSKVRRGISAMKKSIKKKADSSYDKLEMKTILCDPSKNVEDVAVTDSEYNHTQSGVPKSIKNDTHNKQDEYSHLNYKPASFNPNANEEVIKDAPCQGTPTFNPVLQPKIGGNLTEHAGVIRHDYLELEPVGESGDDSIKDDGQPKFEEINSDGTYGFQYECAKEIHQNEN